MQQEMSKPRTILETAATVLLTVAALAVASVYIYGQLGGESGSRGYPTQAALVFQHFPLDGRPLSMPSAVAAECAERQDRFGPMYQLLFAQQESLGSKDWGELAEEAGIPDVGTFEECMKLPADSFPRIEAGRALGLRRNIRGTPTLFVNGRRFGGRSFEEFRNAAEQLGLEG